MCIYIPLDTLFSFYGSKWDGHQAHSAQWTFLQGPPLHLDLVFWPRVGSGLKNFFIFFFHFYFYYHTKNVLFIRVLMVQESHSDQVIFKGFLQPNEYPERIFWYLVRQLRRISVSANILLQNDFFFKEIRLKKYY